MARALRIEMENAWHHVTARGNERRAIFRDNEDRLRFLELLGATAARFGTVVGAYVLMENHYHVVLRTPNANLSRAVQWLNVSYGIGFNRRHRRSGHLFQGRFKSVLVDENEWLGELTRYVHLNPVRTRRFGLGKSQRAGAERGMSPPTSGQLREPLALLRAYRWSSYRAYSARESAPGWLDVTSVLGKMGGGGIKAQQAAYRAYVEAGVRGGLERNPWENVRESAVLGSARFLEKIRTRIKALRGEKHRMRRLGTLVSVEAVRRAVERVKGERWEEFAGRHGDSGRDLFLWLARRHTGRSHAELGGEAGGLKPGAASEAVRILERRLSTDRSLARQAKSAEQFLRF